MSSRPPVAMPLLVRAELLALRTIRTSWILVAAAVLVTLVTALMPVVDSGKNGAASIGTAAATLKVLGALGPASVVILLLGVLTVTSEFRHGTATPTFLQTPRRLRVVAAKATAVVAVAAVLAVVNLLVVLAVGIPTGAVPFSMLNSDIVLYVAGLMLAYPLYGVLGIGIGVLVVYQPLAVVVPLAWLLAELVFVDHLPNALTPWLLRGVTAALANAGDLAGVLPVVVGCLTLLGYAMALLSLGAARLRRRDIT